MAKPFLSFEKQINKLINDKGLVINDRQSAEDALRRIGYFGLIGGYKEPLRNPTNKKFYSHVLFEDILALYQLDESLRELFLRYILKIERHIRSLLSYYFTEKYGEQQSYYLDDANYIRQASSNDDVKRLIGALDQLANQNNNYPYIKYQRVTYQNVPLWVLINAISFGTLSKFYSLLTSDLQSKISKNFEKVNERKLGQYLSVITKFRNVCAHNERLFTYKTKNDIPDTNIHMELEISKKGSQYICGKRDLFAVVISFKYLLPNKEFMDFIRLLSEVIKEYFGRSKALTESKIYKYMGFPPNWQDISTCKK